MLNWINGYEYLNSSHEYVALNPKNIYNIYSIYIYQAYWQTSFPIFDGGQI